MINVLMLSAGVITGSLQMVIDIAESCSKSEFRFFVTHKPGYSDWGNYEIKRLEKVGAEVLDLRGENLFHPFGIIDIARIIRKKNIHILHCWDVLGIFGRVLGKMFGSKVVVEWQNPPPSIRSEISMKHYYINYYSSFLVDGYIACSRGVMKRYVEERRVILSGRKVVEIPNFVDFEHFQSFGYDNQTIKKKFGLGEDEILILTIGYFNRQKVHQDTIKAFKKIVTAGMLCRLVIVGWGELEEELKTLVETLELKEHVIFTGKLEREEVFALLSVADLYVSASHWEGMPIALLEAMIMALPVIATATDGVRQLIENGKTGIIVPIANPHLLSENMMELIAKPIFRKNIGNEGRKRVLQYFNRYRFSRSHEIFYRNIIS